MPKIDNGPPDYRKNLPPIVEQNYGKWEYHESPRPGVLKHVGPAGALYSVRCASPRLVCVDFIRDVCAAEIQEYLALDAKRDASLPVHSIVEAYTGGTAFAWYGMSDYPRLKRFILRKLAQGGAQAKRNFILRASKAQVDLLEDY